MLCDRGCGNTEQDLGLGEKSENFLGKLSVGGNQEFFQQGTWMVEERGLRRAAQRGGTLPDVSPNCFSNRRSQASWETR